MPSRLFLLIFLFSIFYSVFSRSLTDVVCRLNPEKCESYKNPERQQKNNRNRETIIDTFGGPSLKEYQKWYNYEETAEGTGFAREDTGTNPVPYGPGMGNIGIFSNLGVQYGVGSFNYQRDFGISMGGSGRIGGIPVGWGNGGIRQIGSAPWMFPS
ncbi:unnamed protein product [Caenorhabditis angaria]|uniref:Uncharacterized protein n=1 Tax=Caenorhabditis angaria TaxID=860376 RepID=A0A9P1MWI5_9PELO|nr:unnamed protein product [Caenorhabditis angaria]